MYTVEIYKKDGRVKGGYKLFKKIDSDYTNKAELEFMMKTQWAGTSPRGKYRWTIHETYRDVVNIMSGKVVRERYDLPYSCSVGSESYWCN